MTHPSTGERRRHARRLFSPQLTRAWLRVAPHLFPAYITDVSEQGMGMTITSRPPLTEGQTVRVDYLGDRLESVVVVVRHLHHLESDHWHVGVRLENEAGCWQRMSGIRWDVAQSPSSPRTPR
ncbi:MAG: PilZ domain-containing protein [Planctomycetota bacterium]